MTGLKRPRGWIVRRKDVPRGLTAQDIYTQKEAMYLLRLGRRRMKEAAASIKAKTLRLAGGQPLYMKADVWRILSQNRPGGDEHLALLLIVWEAVREGRGLTPNETALTLRLLDPSSGRPAVHLDQLLSTREATDYIGMERKLLEYYCHTRDIPRLIVGLRGYYPIEGLNRLARLLKMEQPYQMNEENYDLVPAHPSGE